MTMRAPKLRNERGAVTAWLASWTVAMILVIGIAVDLGGQVHAQQRAHDLAAQAARVAGEHVDPAQAITGTATTADPGAAKAAARSYLAAAGVEGTVTLTHQGTRITVQVTDHYQPVFLGAMGVSRLAVTGTSTASLVRAVEGTQR